MTNSIIQTFSLGMPQETRDRRGNWTSAIHRQPVLEPVLLETRGFVGDQVADTENHGSLDQAVCCHALSHYAAWNAEYGLLGDAQLVGGAVGENWTLPHQTEANLCIGDIFQVGTARVQVSQPRYPCFKQERKVGLTDFLKRTGDTMRTGWYMRVLTPGMVQVGDALTLEERPCPEWTIERVNQQMHREFGVDSAEIILAAPLLSDGWKDLVKYMLSKLTK